MRSDGRGLPASPSLQLQLDAERTDTMVLKFIAGLLVFVVLSLLVGRWLVDKAVGDRRAPTPEEAAALAARGPQVRTPSGHPPSAEPIVLKTATGPMWENLKWTIGLWFGALVLYGDPTVLWTRWLAWPLGTLMLLGSTVPALALWSEARAGVVTSASGLEFRNGTGVLQQIRWPQVGGVRLVTYFGRRGSDRTTVASSSRVRERETLQLLGLNGEPLLELDTPLRPEAAFQQLLDALPAWTGVPVLIGELDRR